MGGGGGRGGSCDVEVEMVCAVGSAEKFSVEEVDGIPGVNNVDECGGEGGLW